MVVARYLTGLMVMLLCSYSSGAQYTTQQFYAKVDSQLHSYIGKPFPRFDFVGSKGHHCSNGTLKGKATVVDVWELGCMPCMFSIKYFNAIHDSLERNGYQFLSVVKDSWADCQGFITGDGKRFKWDADYVKANYTLPQYEIFSMESSKPTTDNIAATKRLNELGWPLFLIVDKNGIITDANSGFAVGDDVHPERPVKDPYNNTTIKWMLEALQKASSN